MPNKEILTIGKKKKNTQVESKHIKSYLYSDNMVIYVKAPKEPTRHSDLMSKFRNFPGYKINIQKSTLYLHASNEQSGLKWQKNIIK